MNRSTAESVQADTPDALDARSLGRGLAALRIFFGLILSSNGLAKLLGFREISVGPYKSFLITRDEARSILEFEVNARNGGTDVPLLRTLSTTLSSPTGASSSGSSRSSNSASAPCSSSASPPAAPRSSAWASSSSCSSSTSPATGGPSSSHTSGSRC